MWIANHQLVHNCLCPPNWKHCYIWAAVKARALKSMGKQQQQGDYTFHQLLSVKLIVNKYHASFYFITASYLPPSCPSAFSSWQRQCLFLISCSLSVPRTLLWVTLGAMSSHPFPQIFFFLWTEILLRSPSQSSSSVAGASVMGSVILLVPLRPDQTSLSIQGHNAKCLICWVISP